MFPTDINPGTSMRADRTRTTELLPIATRHAGIFAAVLLRALVLLLLGLLLIFVGLMCLTGRYEIGAPVLGSVLLIGLGAAHYAR